MPAAYAKRAIWIFTRDERRAFPVQQCQCVQLLDEPCSRVFDATKEEATGEVFQHSYTYKEREKKKKERDVDGCSVGGAWRKERMHEASMLYLLADVGQGRTAGFQLYRYLSGDNDRMAIAGVAVQRASEVGWIHSGYPLRSIIHPFEVRIPTCNRVQQLHARVHTVERREMLNRAQHSESNEPGRENRIGS